MPERYVGISHLLFTNTYSDLIHSTEPYEFSISALTPECVSDPECPIQLACINEKCKNPCYSHTCGRNAECTVKNHRPICVCLQGFVGNPQTICEERKFYYWNQFIPNRINL